MVVPYERGADIGFENCYVRVHIYDGKLSSKSSWL